MNDYVNNEIQIKILAFDNQNSIEHIIDLDYKALLDLVDSNVHIMNNHADLATFLVNNLVYFKTEKGNEFLVCEKRLYFDDYAQHKKPERKSSSSTIVGLDSSHHLSDSKISGVNDSMNKQLLSKHKRTDKFLHADISTETELEWNIIHEAFDVLFETHLSMYSCQIRLLRGRISNITRVEFEFAEEHVYTLVMYHGPTFPSKKVASEMVYKDEVPQFVVSAETFGDGHGGVIRLVVCDLRLDMSEEMLLQQKEDGTYVSLMLDSRDIMQSEERFTIFRASYGVLQANIDFSTFKFRRNAGLSYDKVLLCRAICNIKIQRIKDSVLIRTDFDEYIEANRHEIYSPIVKEHAVISLYGLPQTDQILQTISSENINKNLNQAQTFTTIYIEICFQTGRESLTLIDQRDCSKIYFKNSNNISQMTMELKNTAKQYKIIQLSKDTYNLSFRELDLESDQVQLNEVRTDFESWEDSSEISQDSPRNQAKHENKYLGLHPREMLKKEYPEIQKSILEKNQKFSIYYIINRRTYE